MRHSRHVGGGWGRKVGGSPFSVIFISVSSLSFVLFFVDNFGSDGVLKFSVVTSDGYR